MRLFTYMDFVTEACLAGEVDTPWSPRWSRPDAVNGLCSPEQVGQPKQPVEPEQPIPDLLPDDMFDHEFAEYRRDPEVYKARNPPALVVKLLATCEERRQRAAIKPAYAVDNLTPRMIASMRSDDLKKFVLHRALQGMPEDDQAAALAGLEPKNASD